MAIVTTNANTITGSATNTLGTLGRSIFNSTIGTFADKDSMNQVYKAIEKLNASIETVEKTFDYEAFNGRNKVDSLYSILAGMDIESSSDFMNKNREFMKRLMRLNKQEKDITLDALGVDVTGESNTVKNEYQRHYEHVGENDYYEDYVSTLRQNQIIGDETTHMQLESSNHFNYSGLHNDLYSASMNLYPDDENKGTFANKWIVENRNSLLYKTKKLFNSKKINTIISRFHTNPNGIPSALDNAKSKYGLSHGRNLLTKEAERGYSSSYRSGYDDPYCRVWTHHHQYDRYYKTIRPFSTVDDQGNYEGTMSVKDFHQWEQFSDAKDNNKATQGKWGWKKDSNNGWQYSVLQDNGMVNITPKYINGEATNIHTKQCMFSIENLAWRGYDPYSFEQALSWEQRGPLGGRIMWFPPYGISFNETTSTQWSNNTFLGRGEDVYTYTNTTRTGVLNFMMVVDHPSILDYVTWSNDNRHSVTDTDILRFLAGCGEGGNDGLRSLAKPTPLTDEYIQVHEEVIAEEKEKEKVEVTPPEPTPDEVKIVENKLCFYVFYPNNYSGTYDNKWSDDSIDGRHFDAGSKVEAIPYLIAGKGAQKSSGSFGDSFSNDLPLDENSTSDANMGNGYEMGKGGLGKAKDLIGNYISGTSRFHNMKGKNGRRYWTGLGQSGQPRNQKYTTGVNNPKDCKKWYYRIDGRYVLPQSTEEEKIHYYNQTLPTKESYEDGSDFGLNNNINKLQETFSKEIIADKDNEGFYNINGEVNSNVFTLAEIAYVLYDGFGGKEGKSKLLAEKCNVDKESARINKLRDILSNIDGSVAISGVAEGYASAHGYVETNKKLGLNRARTAAFWVKHLLLDHYGFAINCEAKALEDSIGDKDVDDNDKKEEEWIVASKNGEDKIHAKKWRYARVILNFNSTVTVSAAESNNTGASEEVQKKESPNDERTIINLGGKISVTRGDGTVKDGSIAAEILFTVKTDKTKEITYQISENFPDVNFKSNKTTIKWASDKEPTSFSVEEFAKCIKTYHDSRHEKYVITSEETPKIVKEDDKKQQDSNNKGGKVYVGFSPTSEKYTDKSDGIQYDVYVDSEGKKWYLKDGKFISLSYASEELSTPKARYGGGSTDENRLRYDQEYHFFKVLKQTDPVVFGSLMDKLQYFDPAFHSMTPEGFNGRLTFLQQCMRQGNTVSASDGKFAKSANNLAFGRAPYCVLRLGDFYNQMIVIDSLSINYDPLVWDLNVEGVGVQPLIAHVTLNFKFVGGGDMTGPVRRLQNAMSFNYYANARLYDNRADRVERKWSDKTNGAIEHGEILSENDLTYSFKDNYGNYTKNGESVYTKGKTKDDVSTFYTTQMYQ